MRKCIHCNGQGLFRDFEESPKTELTPYPYSLPIAYSKKLSRHIFDSKSQVEVKIDGRSRMKLLFEIEHNQIGFFLAS